MQLESSASQDFRSTYNRKDHFCHVKEWKSILESKRTHINVFQESNRNKPQDFILQMRRLILHMIYLYQTAHSFSLDLYVYKPYCINRWGVIFKYYSLDPSTCKFMQRMKHEQFYENVAQLFKQIWKIKTAEEEQDQKDKQEKQQNEEKQPEENGASKKQQIHFNNWVAFAFHFIDIYKKTKTHNITVKDFIASLEQSKHVKNNVLSIGVRASTIFPCIKLNKVIRRVYFQICQDEPYIIGRIFSDKHSNEGISEFTNSMIRFFKALNDFKVLSITSTTSDFKKPKVAGEGESLLVEFKLNLGRVLIEKQECEKKPDQQKMPTPTITSNQAESKTNSENDYNTSPQSKKNTSDNDLGELVCYYFWSKGTTSKQLTFRADICIKKKISPLYMREIEDIWMKLSQKWKVILDETKQLSGFNPGFVMMNYNRESSELTFSEYLKCQPMQSAISQLIITTDKLIIAAIIMRDVVCFYEKKSTAVEMAEEGLPLNDGRYEDLARSICQSVKGYYSACREVMCSMRQSRG